MLDQFVLETIKEEQRLIKEYYKLGKRFKKEVDDRVNKKKKKES